MAAAVVELDALADTVGAAAKDQHLAAVLGLHFVTLFIGGVVIGRVGFEFRGAGIHQVEGGHDAHFLAQTADVGLGTLPHLGELTVGEAVFLGFAQDALCFFSCIADHLVLAFIQMLFLAGEAGF